MEPDRDAQHGAIQSTTNRLAVERTFSAWIRLGTFLAATGAIAGEQVLSLEPEGLWRAIGALFVLAAILIFVYSFWEFFVTLRRIDRDIDESSEGMPVWLMGFVSGLMIVVSSVVLVSVLFL